MMNTPGAHRERTPSPAARCNTLDFHGKSCALAEGLVLASRADVYTIRCSCKQWPCTYTAPCVARTCWEESQTHIAATLWQRRSTHPARALMHAANAPRRSTGNRTPSTTRTPTIRPPGGIPDTPTQPRSDTQPPTLEAVQHPQPHTIRPPDSTKARPTIKPGRLFLLSSLSERQPPAPLVEKKML